MRKMLAGCALLVFSTTVSAQLNNPGFETGDLTGWNALSEGQANAITVASGSTNPGAGTINPSLTNDFYAYTFQSGPGRSILTQAFTVQAGTNRIFFDVAIINSAGDFIVPNPLDYDFGGAPNQQARFDILVPGASVDTENPADIIVVGFQTNPGDPLVQDWTRYDIDVSTDLAPYVGQNVILRFVQVDNQNNFILAIDNLSVGAAPPSTIPGAPVPVPALPFWALLTLLFGIVTAVRITRQ